MLRDLDVTKHLLPPVKFGGHRPNVNGDIYSYINPHMKTLEKAKITKLLTILRDFQPNQKRRFTIQLIYTAGRITRKMRRRRTQAIAVMPFTEPQ